MDWLDDLNERMTNMSKEELQDRINAMLKARLKADLQARKVALNMKGYCPITEDSFRGY